MNILRLPVGVVEKVLAAVVLFALIAGAFPVSFAQAADDMVEDSGEGDLCVNMLGMQEVVPEGFHADGNLCYADYVAPTYTIEGHKYECVYDTEANEGDGGWNCDTPVAGWVMSAENGSDEPITAVTDAEGFYSLTVPSGEWSVVEEYKDSWEQVYTWQDGESIGSYTCDFDFDGGEVVASKMSAKDDEMGDEEADGYCDFGNVHITHPVIGLKWNDENSNGLQDEGEEGIAGWKIYARTTDSEDIRTAEAVTNEDGAYILNLEDGDWTISEESRSRWTQTGVEQDFEMVEGSTCEFRLGRNDSKKVSRMSVVMNDSEDEEEYIPTCSFYNHYRASSGGSSGTKVKERVTPTPQVLGASTTVPACGMYLTEYMREGKAASSTEVTKLQVFLNAVGIKAPLNGEFDAATDAAVRTFQLKYKPEVLTPWYLAKIVPHENPTGWVYQLTRWKINNIVCPGSEAYPVLN